MKEKVNDEHKRKKYENWFAETKKNRRTVLQMLFKTLFTMQTTLKSNPPLVPIVLHKVNAIGNCNHALFIACSEMLILFR